MFGLFYNVVVFLFRGGGGVIGFIGFSLRFFGENFLYS